MDTPVPPSAQPTPAQPVVAKPVVAQPVARVVVAKPVARATGPVDPAVLAAAEGSGEVFVGQDDDQGPRHAAGFFNQPWVQNVLPLASSVFVHLAIIGFGVLAYVAYKQVVTNVSREQVVIPQTSSLTKSKTPGGVPHPGPPADPTRDVAQDQVKSTDDQGFSTDTSKLVSEAGGGNNSNGGFLGSSASSGKGHNFGSGSGGSGTAPWGVPGGGGDGLLPKSSLMGTGGNANDVIFLCDESGSMVSVFGQLKQELKRSISEMSVDENGAMKFNIIFFSEGKPLVLFDGGMQIATPDNKRKATEFVENQVSAGGTNPMPAIKEALAERPQLLYVLTDGFDQIADMSVVTDEFKRADADGHIHINCIFLQADEDPKLVAALQEIANIGKGEFKAILKKDM